DVASSSGHTCFSRDWGAAACASALTASVPAGTAGSATTVTVTVRDANGNKVPGAASLLAGSVSGANTATLSSFTQQADSTYTAAYTPTAAGTDKIAITLDGTAISGSPYSSLVSAGAASGSTPTHQQ